MSEEFHASTEAEKGATTVWRNALADAVMRLLETDGAVTRDTLRRTLEAERDAEGTGRLYRATLQGALNALDGRPPS